MMTAELKSDGGIALNREAAHPALTHQRFPQPNWPAPAPSLRVPVTPGNRARLRAMRQAELRAWNLAPGSNANAVLRAEVAEAAREGRGDTCLFAGIVLTAVVALALGVRASLQFVQSHPDFVEVVRWLLGAG